MYRRGWLGASCGLLWALASRARLRSPLDWKFRSQMPENSERRRQDIKERFVRAKSDKLLVEEFDSCRM